MTPATPAAAADLLPPEWWEVHQLMAAAATDVPMTATTLPQLVLLQLGAVALLERDLRMAAVQSA